MSNSRFSVAARIYQKGCFHVFQQRNRHSPDADACLMCVHCITLHPVRKWCICISRSDACVFLAVMRAYLLICVLMARAVALPLAGVNNMTGYYSRVGPGFYFSCLSGWARQSMQHYAKYAAICEVCNCFSVRMSMCTIGIVFLTQSIVKYCKKYATDPTLA